MIFSFALITVIHAIAEYTAWTIELLTFMALELFKLEETTLTLFKNEIFVLGAIDQNSTDD